MKTILLMLLPFSLLSQKVEKAGGYFIEATPNSIMYQNMEYTSLTKIESVKVNSDSLKVMLLTSIDTGKEMKATFGNVVIQTKPYKKKVSIIIFQYYLSSTIAMTKEDIIQLFNYGTIQTY